MIDNRNIPDADQSWTAAEKMLDRHFRKKRLLIWFISLVIPALIAGFLMMNNPFTKTSDENIVYTNESALTADKSDLTTIDKSSSTNNSLSDTKVERNHININSSQKEISGSPVEASVISPPLRHKNSDIKFSSTGKGETSLSPKPEVIESNPIVKPEVESVIDNIVVINSSVTNSIIPDSDINLPAGYFNDQTDSKKVEQNEIAMVNPIIIDNIDVKSEYSTSDFSWPKQVGVKTRTHVSWEATVYGAAHFVNKTISISNDWNSYLQHRKNEEEAIMTPSLGLALTANHNSLSFSIGAEFSSYGEKTNYFPYSNQQVITDNSSWNTFTIDVIDIDTAYIWGNQRLIETIYQQLDSTFVFEQDTLEEFMYDKKIAETNGINRFYYVEVPVEVSYIISKGKAGFGVSGGLSPGWMVHQKGYYIRPDEKGVDALTEIKSFKKFMVNARLSVDFYYRLGGRTKLVIRPQFKTNLNSIFKDDFAVKQKYYSTGLMFGVSYMLN